MIAQGLEKWRAFMSGHDHDALWAMLDPDVVFESPVVHTPQRGRDITFKYLKAADVVLGNPDFKYVGEWRNETSAILEFETVLDGITVNGIDMITWNAAGLISNFKVMVRPLKAINVVHQQMGAELMKKAG
ncbi:MAG: nuclear transport factor 2 family protein [Hyphomonadaceae bacterium]